MRKLSKLVAVIAAMTVSLAFASCNKKDGASANFKPNPATDFRYELTNDGSGVRILEYIGKSPRIIIPDTIEGLPVKEVWGGKKNNDTITHVVFPDSATDIGVSFRNCSALQYVKLPANTLYYTDGISSSFQFWDCKKLKTVIIPEGCDITGSWAGCPIESVTFPSTLKKVSTQAFENCGNLREIIIPESITELKFGGYAFNGTNLPLATQARLKQFGY